MCSLHHVQPSRGRPRGRAREGLRAVREFRSPMRFRGSEALCEPPLVVSAVFWCHRGGFRSEKKKKIIKKKVSFIPCDRKGRNVPPVGIALRLCQVLE